MRLRSVAILVLLALGISACGATGIQVRDAWVRPVLQGGVGAAYFVIRNPGNAADRLLSAECDCAETLEIHTMIERNGVMEMRPIAGGLDVPAGGELVFGSGGMHIMLIGMQRNVAIGDSITLTLHFQQQGAIQVLAQVRTS